MTAAAEWTTNDKLQHYRQILGLNGIIYKYYYYYNI